MAAASDTGDREFRNALGLFPTGVAIITAEVDGNRLGATVSSFNSVSLQPRLVLFSLARSSNAIAQWRAAKALAISILGQHQTDLSNRFARSAGGKWDGLADLRASNGSPLPPGALACFECRPYAIHDGGDHDIFVCEVTSYTIDRLGTAPLVFFSGKYRRLGHEDGSEAPPHDNLWLHGW